MRLSIHADGLRNLHPSLGFNMGHWFYPQKSDRLWSVTDLQKPGCTACAIGHACLMSLLHAQGLRNEGDAPFFEGFRSWDAVKEFFGLTMDEARYLFDSTTYPMYDERLTEDLPDQVSSGDVNVESWMSEKITAKDVAQRIETFLIEVDRVKKKGELQLL